MIPSQCFRQGERVVQVMVGKNSKGQFCNTLPDVQRSFPGASWFEVDGNRLVVLKDKNGIEDEPKSIAYIPDKIIDVIDAGPDDHGHFPFRSIPSPPSAESSPHTRPLSNHSMDLVISNLSLQSPSSSNSSAVVKALSPLSPPSSAPCHRLALQDTSTADADAVLSNIAAEITKIEQQHEGSTSHSSVDPQHILDQLVGLLREQNEAREQKENPREQDHHQQLSEQPVQLLQEQAEAEERDEGVLAELAAAKERDEEMHRMQRQTIDRLIVAQHRIEAILVQNYELHEYPIPRLFVILPDSYERWDPRNILAKRFRLYFLCECGDHCKTDPGTTTTASPTSPIPVRYSIHLAKHEGYELSHPTEFFDLYGPYILGMLRILKHCLAVATVVAPAVASADNTIKDIMDAVKMISESTMMAVDMSIDFLEQRLDEDVMADGATGVDASTQEEDMFRRLAALEVADLRRLDSFLRNRDADKILGNLYRITTETGYVRWVCLDHYRQLYRENSRASFIQSIEVHGGTFDSQVGKVTVSLKSAIAAEDFFSTLCSQASFVIALKVDLKWPFGSADLAMLVDKIAKSNVSDLEVDLQDFEVSSPFLSRLLPGKGRYHPLLGLLSNTKLRDLRFSSVSLIGPRTSSLPSNQSPSLLQSLRISAPLGSFDDTRLAEIIHLCPHLVDLRLGAPTMMSKTLRKLDQALGSLSKLQTLHRYHLGSNNLKDIGNVMHLVPYGSVALRELVNMGLPFSSTPDGYLERAIYRSAATLEVLYLKYNEASQPIIDLANLHGLLSPSLLSSSQPFAKLTHLQLLVKLTPASLELMSSLLPRLTLDHLEVNESTSGLLAYVNFKYLKSLFGHNSSAQAIDAFSRALVDSPYCQLEFLMLSRVPITKELQDILSCLPLKRLSLVSLDRMDEILRELVLKELQALTIYNEEYNWKSEALLAARNADFTDEFVVELVYKDKEAMRDVHNVDNRSIEVSSTKLARRCVRVLDQATFESECYSDILPSMRDTIF
ncbi:MAG: hypothetical protein J3R72DRAFT_472200 [Linnemannia gamsii]|nr:MAG: hypothetical protein J3R72DRAFT_472200 [Linnemannia gamsii]